MYLHRKGYGELLDGLLSYRSSTDHLHLIFLYSINPTPHWLGRICFYILLTNSSLFRPAISNSFLLPKLNFKPQTSSRNISDRTPRPGSLLLPKNLIRKQNVEPLLKVPLHLIDWRLLQRRQLIDQSLIHRLHCYSFVDVRNETIKNSTLKYTPIDFLIICQTVQRKIDGDRNRNVDLCSLK